MKFFFCAILVGVFLGLTGVNLSYSEEWYFRVHSEDPGIRLRALSVEPVFQGHHVLDPVFYHNVENKQAQFLSKKTIIKIDEKNLFAPKKYYYKYNLQGFEHSQRGFVRGVQIISSPTLTQSEIDRLNQSELFISFLTLNLSAGIVKVAPAPALVPRGMDWKKELKDELYLTPKESELAQLSSELSSIKSLEADDPKFSEVYMNLQKLYDLTKESLEIEKNEVNKIQEEIMEQTQLEPMQENNEHDHSEDEGLDHDPSAVGGSDFGIEQSELFEILALRNYIGNLSALGGDEVKPLLEYLDSIPQGVPVLGEDFILTSGYKWRWGRFHAGFDYAPKFRNASSKNLVATADGTIIFRGYERGYGNLIKIQMENLPIQIWYGHIASGGFRVDVGDKVQKDQIIAQMGNTGRSTGTHVHYEVRIRDPQSGKYLPINPAEFVK